MTSDPLEGLPAARRAKSIPHFLSRDEMQRLLEAARATEGPLGLRDLALVELLYGTGIRVTELCTLVPGALSSPDKRGIAQLKVLGKGRKERLTPVHAGARAALEMWITEGRPEWAQPKSPERIFLGSKGGPLRREVAYRRLRELGLAARIRQVVTPHLLRHTFATHLVHEGADLRAIQEMLGHANLETTTIYTSVDAARFRDLHRKFHPRG